MREGISEGRRRGPRGRDSSGEEVVGEGISEGRGGLEGEIVRGGDLEGEIVGR